MKRFLVAPVLALTVGLLAGCNPASLLGDIKIGADPMKLDGQVVGVPLAAKTTSGLSAKADGPMAGIGTKTVTFNDIDSSSFSAVGNPKKLAQILGVKGAELVTTDPAQPACTVQDGYSAKVTINSLKLTVTEASSSKTFGASTTGSFTVSKTGSAFVVSLNSDMTLGLSGDFSVLTSGGINTGTVAFDIGVVNAPSNCTLKITLKGGEATVAF
jgi:hypothetical protein